MAAKGKVEYIITTDDAKAMSAMQSLLTQVRKSGRAMGDTKKESNDLFDSIEKKALAVLGPAGVVAGAMAAAKVYMDNLVDSVKALNVEQERAGSLGRDYAAAFGEFVMNAPGISPQDARRAEQSIFDIASQSALGPEGLPQLVRAFTTIQSSIPNESQETKLAVLRETAQLLELQPTLDAPGAALGIAKLVSQGDMSPNEAQNLLRQAQSQGLVAQTGDISRQIPRILSVAEAAGVGPRDALALMATGTQVLGDPTGDKTATAMVNLLNKVEMNEGDIEGIIGGGFNMRGNALQKFGQVIRAIQSGRLRKEQIFEIIPKIGRGADAATLVRGFAGGALDDLITVQGILNDPAALTGDLTADDIATMEAASPTVAATLAGRRRESALAIDRLREPGLVAAGEFRRIAGDVFSRYGIRENSREAFFFAYDRARQSGMPESAALARGMSQLEESESPFAVGGLGPTRFDLPGRLMRGTGRMPVPGGFGVGAIPMPVPIPGLDLTPERDTPERVDTTQALLAAILVELQGQNVNTKAPRLPLNTRGDSD